MHFLSHDMKELLVSYSSQNQRPSIGKWDWFIGVTLQIAEDILSYLLLFSLPRSRECDNYTKKVILLWAIV